MRRLYHFCLQPASRKLRILLKEKSLEFELQAENAWERREAFLALNHAGEVPVLVEPDGTTLADATAIAEYLDEMFPEPPLLGKTPLARAEVRRLVGWFDVKFNREVTVNLLDQKILRRLSGNGGPDSQAIRAGNANIHYHLEYIAWLADRRNWLAGDDFSLADIAAAAPWDRHADAKNWYARVKSRPSFRALLADGLPGIAPPAHYTDLDF
jgi:glutathione S-transferase